MTVATTLPPYVPAVTTAPVSAIDVAELLRARVVKPPFARNGKALVA